jgi:hypothetical protein
LRQIQMRSAKSLARLRLHFELQKLTLELLWNRVNEYQ